MGIVAPKKRHRKMSRRRMAGRLVMMGLGATLVAFGIEMFLVPNYIIDGGIVGIAIMVSHLTGLPLGLFLLAFNLPFLLLGYNNIGKTFALSTLFSVSVMSAGTALLKPVPAVTTEPLLAAVFGGIVLGIGVGLVIRSGGSLDGTEIIAIMINERTPFSVGETIMFFNIFILGSSAFLFGVNNAMYSLIAYYIAFKMIDLTIEGFEESRSVWIISDQHEEIGDAILCRLGRGVTYLEGQGAYTGEGKKVIFVVITRLEEAKLKSIVEEWDPHAFLAVGTIHDVQGGRFKKKMIH